MDKLYHILIVEDSQVQSLILKRLLLKNNYQVTIAVNGAEGLEYTKKYKPDIIISDIAMPVMDGYEMCGKIKDDEEFKDIPIILLTQLSSTVDIISGINSKADSFITKPYSESYLLYVINYYISLKKQDSDNKDTDNKMIKKNVLLNKYIEHISNEVDVKRVMFFMLSTYEHKIFQSKEQLEIQASLKTINEQHKNRINELISEKEIYQSIFISAPDIIYSLDKDGKFTHINEVISNYGYTPSALIGKHFSEIFMSFLIDENNKVTDVDFKSIIKGTNLQAKDKDSGVNERLRYLQLKIKSQNMSAQARLIETGGKEYVLVEINSFGLYNTIPHKEEKIFLGSTGVMRDLSYRVNPIGAPCVLTSGALKQYGD
ncbi:MAG: response regulator [Nitrospirae bacterium]|nr:response regulator [Nitrospirota bacterium]MBF0541218.1 response regulator [Nitrospirota bacterium]